MWSNILMMTPTLTLDARKSLVNQSEWAPSARLHPTQPPEISATRANPNRVEDALSRFRGPRLSATFVFSPSINRCNMDFEDVTVSSFTTEPENLTEIHQSSGLPIEHHSRRTEAGFVIKASRLPNCVPLPACKIPPRSWV